MFRIKITSLPLNNGKPAYAADREKQWDYSWYTRKPQEAKTFKLERNAKRWLSERPDVTGIVEAVNE